MKKSMRSVLFTFLLFAFLPIKLSYTTDSFDVISKKNLFHPDRKEWKQEKKGTENTSPAKKKLQKPPKLELFGTIIVGGKAMALISNKTERGSKVDAYSMGDYIGEYVISEIYPRRVVLGYYDEKITLWLHEGKNRPMATTGRPIVMTPSREKRAGEAGFQKRVKDYERFSNREAEQKIKPRGYKRITPFMNKQERKEVIEYNKRLLEEMRNQ